MGESACLVRSFSHTADASREAKEGDSIRALTESVSFGRFMSESLAWEKWSTFSHNRYLEEVEKFSKPGTVAEKKAYFEAHYKRRAAMRAAALLEESNTAANDALQMESTDLAMNDSSLNTESTNENTPVVIDPQQEKDAHAADTLATDDANGCNPVAERDNLVATDVECQTVLDQTVIVDDDLSQVENSKHVENANNDDMIMEAPDEKIPRKESSDQENLGSSSKKRRTDSSSKPSTHSNVSKPPLCPSRRVPPVQARNGNNVAVVRNKSAGDSNSKKRIVPSSFHMSINFTSHASGTTKTSLKMPKSSLTSSVQAPTRVMKKAADKENVASPSTKTQSNAILKSSSHGGASKPPVSPAKLAAYRIDNKNAFTNKKSAEDLNEKKRMVSRSLHTSMNFASRAGESSKTLHKMPRYGSNPLRTSLTASVSGESNYPLKVLHSEEKRTKPLLSRSVSGGLNGKLHSQSDCSKSSTASGSKPQSPINSCPFIFRSEERAAKRKEMLEEKIKKEAEKGKIQTKPKIPSMRPGSPKLGRKPSPSRVKDTSSPPPRKLSIQTEGSRLVTKKNNRTACSVTSLAKKRHENASPNIQP